MSLVAGNINRGSQQVLNLSAGFEAATGSLLAAGVTLSRVFVNGYARVGSEAVTATDFSVGLAVQLVPLQTDLGDFYGVMAHEGRPQLSWISRLLEPPSGAGVILLPTEQATIKLETKSQRTVVGHGQAFFLVVEKDGATEFTVVVGVAVTCLWLY